MIHLGDLGGLTVEQVGQRRGINVAQFGITNPHGCFTTSGQPVSGGMQTVLQGVQNAAALKVQRNLSQEEVSLILAQQAVSKRKVQDLMDHAVKVKDAWVSALDRVQALKSCWFCADERKAYNDAWSKAADMLRGLTPRSTEAFRSVDFLMVFAQDPREARDLCEAKLNARAQYQAILDQIQPVVQKVNSEEAALDAAKQGMIERLMGMLQTFISLLRALVEVIASAFKGLVAAVGFVAGTLAPFVAANPKVVLYGTLGTIAAGFGLVGFIKYRQAKFALLGRI